MRKKRGIHPLETLWELRQNVKKFNPRRRLNSKNELDEIALKKGH